MWDLRRLSYLFISFLGLSMSAFDLYSQELEPEVICGILGLSSVEEVGEEEIMKLEHYLAHPLPINRCSFSNLQRSGLFSPYQAANIVDYISRTGDILSLYELSMVDGFNQNLSRFYSMFLDFSSDDISSNNYSSHKLHLRGGLKSGRESKDFRYDLGLKYSAEIENKLSIRTGFNWPESQAKTWPLDASFHLTWHMRNLDLSIGDINFRFAQGLALWTGLSFSSLPSYSLFMKNPRGLGMPDSYTGGSCMTGLGLQINSGRWVFTTALALKGLREGRLNLVPVFNASWYGRKLRLGHTATVLVDFRGGQPLLRALSSIDIASCLKGTDIFAEFAVDWTSFTLAGLVGFRQPLGDYFRMAMSTRYYPSGFKELSSGAQCSISKVSNEVGGNLAIEFKSKTHQVDLGTDFAWHPDKLGSIIKDDWQERVVLDYILSKTPWIFAMKYSFKLRGNFTHSAQESRYASFAPRHECRIDLRHEKQVWNIGLRTHFQYSKAFSFLTFIEGAYKQKRFKLYLRQGFFWADNWEDRIYTYERDLPQSFSLPAHYGRGLWTSGYASFDLGSGIRIIVKASYEAWPWNVRKKSGRAGLKIFSSFSF